MNGFITESVSKLSDGIGNSIRLLSLYLVTTLLVVPINTFFYRIGVLIYLFVLLAMAVFELQRSLTARTSDPKRAWSGMAAGIYFWQVIRFAAQLDAIHIFQQSGIIFWIMVVLITASLWKKFLPIGLRTATLTLLSCWLGKIYVLGFAFLENWSPIVVFGYQAIRYICGVGGLFILVYILFKSENAANRSYAAILFFASLLFLFLLF
ncbi:MAG: hypothetical protein VB013_10040 [Anaerolineaceae bacterium]|nr:hypothetical protein [Anaerolineaceae bacterium]